MIPARAGPNGPAWSMRLGRIAYSIQERLPWLKRRPRLTIQRMMVAVVFLAILSCFVARVAPDLYRRWDNCRLQALRYEGYARQLRAEIAFNERKEAQAQYPERLTEQQRALIKRLGTMRDLIETQKATLLQYENISRDYMRARWRPWRWYAMGDVH